MSNFNPSRRRFIKSAVIAGVSVYLAPLYSRAYAALFEQKILQSPNWDPQAKRVRFRIDGRAKVMGQKVFARDIRAVDMPHWPQKQAHAFILRVTKADRLFEGVDLSLLGDDLQPDRLVTAEDLARDGLAFPAFYGDDMLLPSGKTPAYLGQAVAILIYHDFARFRFAKDKLKFREETIKYGAVTGPLERDPWGSFRYVRVGGEQPFDDDRFSSLKDTPIFPVSMKKHLPVWPEGREGGKLDQEGMRYAGMIADELANPPADWLVMSRRYTTQSIDTSALEPDNANGWFDAQTQTLHLVVPTQSPQEVADEMPRMLAKRNPPVKQLILHPCYTVGYGSKDHYNFPYYGAVAAMYGDGHPVRLANDRFEQFQTALKRHAFDMNYRIAVNKQTGVMQSFLGDMTADGGGRSNFTPSVVMVGATAAQSIYYFPKSDLSSVGLASRAIDAGSARGYGTLQSMAATEMMVDELAAELKIDPIEFRLRNVLKSGMKNTQGAIPAGAIRADEVLEKAAGMSVLSLELLAKTAYQMGGVTGAAVHVFNRWQWAEADFTLNGKSERLPVDGMALRNAGGEFKPLARGQVYYPPTQRNNAAVTYYSAVGTLAEVAVDIATGQVELLNHHSIMECGNLIVPELVSGQLQGGLAMGIGHALHEYLPLYEDGPGNGTWNFNRYHLPRASDVAVWKQSGDILPALSETDPPKGMAEVVMIPIVAALVNAIADATGHRFRDLPVRAENIREVLQ
ncbi:xanthine dehydrogenase family protein molybdopterin-binding subunit [Serratia ureilytica]|uniref:xanthine dehydrogenase family protein molybdopterin-binding subunit n=1 Tax=Serratia ureilytica TaxID=300181 RepID=UPI003F81CFDE